LHSMQKYRTWYLLAKLTQYVDMAYQGSPQAGRLSEYENLEIEHILPNKPDAGLRAAFTEESPGADYDACKDRLGNLTLLEKPINIVAGNGFFEAKKVEYRKCKNYLTSSLAELAVVGRNSSITRINEKLIAFEKWTASSIEQRQLMLIELAKMVWATSLLEE